MGKFPQMLGSLWTKVGCWRCSAVFFCFFFVLLIIAYSHALAIWSVESYGMAHAHKGWTSNDLFILYIRQGIPNLCLLWQERAYSLAFSATWGGAQPCSLSQISESKSSMQPEICPEWPADFAHSDHSALSLVIRIIVNAGDAPSWVSSEGDD